jgi:hypothetical protein
MKERHTTRERVGKTKRGEEMGRKKKLSDPEME